jgi:ribonucleoside-diphosphate reductase alpha chain
MTQVFSPHARALLSNFYGDKDPSELFHDAAYGYGSRPELAARIEEYATKGWFMFASPVLSNVKQGLPISCFLSYVPDTVDGLIQHQSEFAYMSVMGGGVGGHWSDVRGADTVKAPGIIPFMKVLDAEQESFRQGRTRKGSYASYLDVSHPEIEEFLGVRTPSGGDANRKCLNMNIGVNISDNFMDAVISGKEWDFICPHTGEKRGSTPARKLWEAILETRFRTGEPYLHFIDTSNDWLNQWQKQKGLKIRGSNLCMAGSDRVVTSRGYLTAKELYEQGGELEVFDGVHMQKATEMRLIEKDVPTYKITLKNGLTHTVTGYHKIKTDRGETPCQDLKVGDRVHIQSNKGLFGTTSMEDEAFLLGLYQADGTQHKDIIMLDLWEDDFDLVDEIEERFERVHHKYGCDTVALRNQTGIVGTKVVGAAKFHNCTVNQSTVAKKRLASKTLKKALDFTKGEVPYWIWEADEATQWQYIRGLFYADGCVSLASSRGEPIYLSISNVNKDFLNDLHLLLRNLGLPFALHMGREAGFSSLPDGKGGYKDYPTQTCYRLVCGSKNAALLFEEKTGFLTRRGVQIENRKWRDNSRKVSEVIAVEYVEHQDVYCLTVDSETHLFVANGVITHNCSEILECTDENRSAVCCLSSLNLEMWDEWKDTGIVEDLIEFLDDVLQSFIDRCKARDILHKARYSAEMERSLGLGTMGFHSLLQKKNIPFEGVAAIGLNRKIFKTISERAKESSRRLAKERGEPQDLVGSGRRNANLIAIAPNSNSSILLGTSPSIEPWSANEFVSRTRAGVFLERNKYLAKLLDQKGLKWEDCVIEGSVQQCEHLTEAEKAVFKTAFELDQAWLLEHAAKRQEFICQGQSLNLFIGKGYSRTQFSKLHIRAWESGLKTLYYCRVDPKTQAKITIQKESKEGGCVSCEG